MALEAPPVGRFAGLWLAGERGDASQGLAFPGETHFCPNCCKVTLTKNGLSNSVVSPQPLPTTGRRRAESGLCHFTERLAMSAMMSDSCSAVVSPGRGIVSKPVPQTAE